MFRASDGQWATTISADADLARAILGPNGEHVLALERDSGATIVSPRDGPLFQGPADLGVRPAIGEILVRSPDPAAVALGRAKLESLADAALDGPALPHTHFVGFPLCLRDDTVPNAIRALRAETLAAASPSERVHASDFVEPGRANVQLCALKLCSDERRRAARSATEAARRAATLAMRIDTEGAEGAVGAEGVGTPIPPPLRARIAGLRCARGDEYGDPDPDPSDVDVVYLDARDPDEDPNARGRLTRVCEAIVGAYRDAGLLTRRDDAAVAVRPRCVVMDARGRADGGGGMDATETMRRSGGTDCGDAVLDEVHLSKLGEFDVALGGYYRCEASAKLS